MLSHPLHSCMKRFTQTHDKTIFLQSHKRENTIIYNTFDLQFFFLVPSVKIDTQYSKIHSKCSHTFEAGAVARIRKTYKH